MRHNKSGRKLNRNSSHRSAMFKNMARAVLIHETIRTTEAKAKELRGVVDGLITLALKNDLSARRQAYKVLGNHQLVKRLFDEVGPRYTGGNGGYTRIVKLLPAPRGRQRPHGHLRVDQACRAGCRSHGPKAEPKTEAAPAE
jgi:large subunit ribosomal protein L17